MNHTHILDILTAAARAVEADAVPLCNDQKMAVDIADQLGDFNPDDTQRARAARIAAYRDESEEVAERIAAGDA